MRKAARFFVFLLFSCVLFSAVAYTSVSSAKGQIIKLRYDDYYNLSEYKAVEITDSGEPESYKVGYGVRKGTKDDAVFEIVDGVLHATGVGEGKITLDETEYTVKVEAAPISMFLLLGQSNMYGSDGESSQSVANENGQAYSTFFHPESFKKEDAAKYVPSALSGKASLINRAGTTENLKNSPLNRLTVSGKGKAGFDSGFAYEYNKITGDKVWAINIAKGATAIRKWQRGAAEYETAVAIFSQAQRLMQEEIKAGHYILKDYGLLWCQGCSDRINTAEFYVNAFLKMYSDLKEDLTFDIDADGKKETLRFCNIIMPRKGGDDVIAYRNGINSDETNVDFFTSFRTLEMSGPRVAQYWLVNNPAYPEINLVCNIGEKWVTMPDGSDEVEEYFAKKYKNGRVDYPVQVQQPKQWYTPKTPEDVHDNMHFNQIGYNEAGFEAARNSAYILGRAEKPKDVKTTVTFYDWTGYRKISSINAVNWADSRSVVVPVVYPVYESKSVTYKLSDNLDYNLYDLTAAYKSKGGTLESVGADVNKKLSVRGTSSVKEGGAAYYYERTPEGLNSVSGNGYQSNKLRMLSGTVVNGKHRNVVYQLEKTVNLKKDNKWIVEWTGGSTSASTAQRSFVLLSGYVKTSNISHNDIAYMLHKYTRGKKASLTMAVREQRNTDYIASSASASVNPNEYHTYTMWNEPSSKGSNKVHFAVDGKWVGELTNVSGRDFSFRFLGTDNYAIDNYIFKNIRIIESADCSKYGHSIINKTVKATCTAKGSLVAYCEGCGYKTATYTNALGHKYSTIYTSDKNATYFKDGTKSLRCSRCSAKKTVTDKGSKLILGKTSEITSVGKGTSVTLSWKSVKDATGYRVYIKENGSWEQIKLVSGTQYTVTDLTPMTDYEFAVKAYVKEDSKVVNAPKYTTVSTSSGLAAPTIRVASTEKGRATVAWSNVEGESGYQLYYATSKDGRYIKLGNYGKDTLKVYKSLLQSEKTYYFKVRAYAAAPAGFVYSDFSEIKSLKIK